MAVEGSATIEGELRRLWDEGDLRAAAGLAIESYGPEVYGFLVATMCNDDDAEEAFAQAGADLCAGLGRFGWRCPLRAWLYVLARNAASRLRRSPARGRGRIVPLSQISEVAERERSRTATFLRTGAFNALERLRQSLDPDERSLLALRIDRAMSWVDIARIMCGAESDERALKREAARLRKRFQVLKDRLRASARKVASER